MSANPAQRTQLIWSLLLNILTRAPGAVGLILILPLIRFSLGDEDYYLLLSLIAFGAVLTFLFGGYNTILRRRIGSAHAEDRKVDEANAVVTVLAVNLSILFIGLCVIAARASSVAVNASSIVIPGIVLTGAFLNTFDNIRAAYNEHYVTAIVQIICQSLLLLAAYLFPHTRESLVMDTMYIAGYTAIASGIAAIMLLRKRPYLLTGKVDDYLATVKSGFFMSTSDGLMMAALNLSVVFIGSSASHMTSAWYATLVRLFQTVLTPVLLVLMPFSSFIRLRWNAWNSLIKMRTLKWVLALGLGYGLLSVFALLILDVVYIKDVMKLSSDVASWISYPIFMFFASVIVYKSYSTITFVLFDNSLVPRLVTAISLAVIGVCFTNVLRLDAVMNIAVCSMFASVAILASIIYDFSQKIRYAAR